MPKVAKIMEAAKKTQETQDGYISESIAPGAAKSDEPRRSLEDTVPAQAGGREKMPAHLFPCQEAMPTEYSPFQLKVGTKAQSERLARILQVGGGGLLPESAPDSNTAASVADPLLEEPEDTPAEPKRPLTNEERDLEKAKWMSKILGRPVGLSEDENRCQEGSEDIMRPKTHGTSDRPVQQKLRWNCDPNMADRICNFNRAGAEPANYFMKTEFSQESGSAQGSGKSVTFYDSNSGLPLFTAPKQRQWNDFVQESHQHGWPSFNSYEVHWENVRVLKDGEAVSTCGTHLGHRHIEQNGRHRFCINLVSIAGYAKDALSDEVPLEPPELSEEVAKHIPVEDTNYRYGLKKIDMEKEVPKDVLVVKGGAPIKLGEKAHVAGPVKEEDEVNVVKIAGYSWLDEGPQVCIYVEKDKEPDVIYWAGDGKYDKVKADFQARSATLRVKGLGSQTYVLKLKDLPEDIEPAESKVRVSEYKRITLKLKKKICRPWHRLQYK